MDHLLHLLLEPLLLCTVQNKALEGLLIWGFWFFSLLGCFDRGPFHSQLLQLFLHRPVLLVQQIGHRLLKSVWAQAEPKGINVWFNNDSCLFRTFTVYLVCTAQGWPSLYYSAITPAWKPWVISTWKSFCAPQHCCSFGTQCFSCLFQGQLKAFSTIPKHLCPTHVLGSSPQHSGSKPLQNASPNPI